MSGVNGRVATPYRRRPSYKEAVSTKSADHKSESSKTTEPPAPFVLQGRQPDARITAKWLNTMHIYASHEFSEWGLQWPLHPQFPRASTEIKRPVRPDPDDYDSDDEHDRMEKKIDIEIYGKKRLKADNDEEAKRKMEMKQFNHMTTHMDDELKNEISTRLGTDIWTKEQPDELIDAVKSLFLGQTRGTRGNTFDVDKAETAFANVNQHQNESAPEFRIRYGRVFKAMIQAQVNGGANETEAEKAWTVERKVKHYAARMNAARMPQDNLYDNHLYHKKPLPATMEELYEEHCLAEQRFFGTAATERARANVFMTSAKPSAKQTKKSNKSQKSTGGARIDDADRPLDRDGKWVCWNSIIGNCKFPAEECQFSHKPVANGKDPPKAWTDKHSAKPANTAATANAVARAKALRFATEDELDQAVMEAKTAIANSLLAPRPKPTSDGAKKTD